MKEGLLLGIFLAATGVIAADSVSSEGSTVPISRMVQVGGVSVHYRESGGTASSPLPPLLLVHGWLGSSYDFFPLMQSLPSDARTIAVDLPGSGASQKSGIDFSLDYYLKFLAEFLQLLGIDRIVLVGHSMGGELAVHFAARNPGLIDALVLIDPDGLAGEEGLLGVLRRMGILVDLGFALNNRFAIRFATRWNVFHNRDLVSREYIDSVAESSLTREGRRAQAAITKRVLGSSPVDKILPSLHMPTLVIWGANDRVLAPKWGPRFVEQMPNATLSPIPESGHLPQFEAPAEVAGEIMGFLRHVSLGG